MKQKLLKVITALMLVMTLTMVNVVFLGVNVISYALDEISAEKSTSHKNVEFMAYLSNEEGAKTTETEIYSDTTDMSLILKVSVKHEGYFNGSINLENTNFVVKQNENNDFVNRIENNVVYLNQINSGETKEIKLNIEAIKENNFDLSLINMEGRIAISGIYRDSKEKDIKVSGERKINVLFSIRKDVAEQSNVLKQEVITNKILNYKGEDKRIVQIAINSGVANNLYPVKEALLNVQAPKIAGEYPEEAFVNGNDVLATSGDKLNSSNWDYDNETGMITVNIKNNPEGNRVNWTKNKLDRIIVTYIFDKDVNLEEEKSYITSKIEFYDINKTTVEGEDETALSNNEADGIVSLAGSYAEGEIFKGNLYFGKEKDVTEKNVIDVNIENVINQINVLGGTQILKSEEVAYGLESNYKTTKIYEKGLREVLGESGKLLILDNNTNSIISQIDSNVETTDGIFMINYPANISNIRIVIDSPEKIGRIEMESIRNIKPINGETVRRANEIESITVGSYIATNLENKVNEASNVLKLKETETSAKLEISKTEFSTMTTNKNVEFRITLNSNNEKDELYKNPRVRLVLPEKFENIQVNSVNLLYEDEMTAQFTQNGNVLEILFNGEQTSYKGESIEGTLIIINADLTTNRKIASGTENVRLEVSNEKAINLKDNGIVEKAIDIVSYSGVVTVTEVEEYGIEVINSEGTDTATLPVSSEAKNITFENTIINNKEIAISDVTILGTLPTKEATEENNIDASITKEVSVLGIDASRAKIYYSENAKATENLQDENNAWVEGIANNQEVKKYLIKLDKLEIAEEMGLTYAAQLPEGLEYNNTLNANYTVFYNNESTALGESVNSKNINLTTGKGAVIDAQVEALVGNQETKEVRKGEVVRFAINVSNSGTEAVNNIYIKGQVPEGTVYVEKIANFDIENIPEDISNHNPYVLNNNLKEVSLNINSLGVGETKTISYEVQVKENTTIGNIKNKIVVSYSDITKESNEIALVVKDAKLVMGIYGIDCNGYIEAGNSYRFMLNMRNLTNTDLKNVKIDLAKTEEMDLFYLSYKNAKGEYVGEQGKDYIVIDSIPANGYVDLSIEILTKSYFASSDKINGLFAKAIYNNVEYHSNLYSVVAKSIKVSFDVSSENSGGYVKSGDLVQYKIGITNIGNETANNIAIENKISPYTTLKEVKKNNENVESSEEITTVENMTNINPGETEEYVISVVVDNMEGNTEALEIINNTKILVNSQRIADENIKHIIEPDLLQEIGNPNDPGDSNNSGNQGGLGNNITRIISGTVWIDKNENGKRDSGENYLDGIKVSLINPLNNEKVKKSNGDEYTVKTNADGFYSFASVPQGEYLVIFEYDSSKYAVTHYKKDGVSEQDASKAISKKMRIDGTEKVVGVTEIIKVENSNIANVNMGLLEAKVFDLKLDKYVSRIVVQNAEGTRDNAYQNETLAKAEIKSKLLNSTSVVVEYTIKISNEGQVDGYAKKIVDYLSKDYKFSADLNKDWYQTGDGIYNTSLANEIIRAGESKEIKLVVTKQMNESNIGLVTNVAEIAESYNEAGLQDRDSKAGNNLKGEDDMGTADVILSLKTGEVIATILLVITSLLMVGAATFIITRIVLQRKIM